MRDTRIQIDHYSMKKRSEYDLSPSFIYKISTNPFASKTFNLIISFCDENNSEISMYYGRLYICLVVLTSSHSSINSAFMSFCIFYIVVLYRACEYNRHNVTIVGSIYIYIPFIISFTCLIFMCHRNIKKRQAKIKDNPK